MGKGLEQTLVKGGYTRVQKRMKRCSVSLAIKDANSNHNEVPPHTSQSGQHKQINKQMLERMREKREP